MAKTTPFVDLKATRFKEQSKMWPPSGKHILAQFDDSSIIVYQAYNDKIADAALKCQNFHSEDVIKAGYSLERMTWVKTNFLWMMYRSGWASKENQTRILAMKITRSGFEEILSQAKAKGNSPVRLQWDPDHTPDGEKVLTRRAIQLGLRGEVLKKFSHDFILSITDMTEFVREQVENVTNDSELLIVPVESVYECLDAEVAENVGLDKVLTYSS